MLVVWFRNVIPGTFFIFGKPTVYKQRNSVLFQWITSEVSFPVVYLHSCPSRVLCCLLNIKGFVKSNR